MVHVIIMPKLGLTMETGKIIQWKKAEGDWVEKGEIVYVLETEKLTYEVLAEAPGYLHILVGLETEVPVAGKVGYLASTREEYGGIASQKAEKIPAEGAPAEAAGPAPSPASPTQPAAISTSKERVKISPVARKIAEEKGIDLNLVQGTGPGGMIQEK